MRTGSREGVGFTQQPASQLPQNHVLFNVGHGILLSATIIFIHLVLQIAALPRGTQRSFTS